MPSAPEPAPPPAAQATGTRERTLLDAILPTGAVAAEEFGDLADVALFPAEAEQIRKAVDSRRREFATARACARRAMATFGVGPVAVLSRGRGAPVWPAGLVGSLTHCPGYRAAALARAADVRSLGIDAEPAESLPDKGILRLVADAGEQTHLASRHARFPDVPWDRLLFSVKESIYKAWYPLAERWLGFDDVELELSVPAAANGGTFRAALRVDGPVVDGKQLTELTGRWLVSGGFVLSSAFVLPGQGP